MKLKTGGANGNQVKRLEQIGMVWKDGAVREPITRGEYKQDDIAKKGRNGVLRALS